MRGGEASGRTWRSQGNRARRVSLGKRIWLCHWYLKKRRWPTRIQVQSQGPGSGVRNQEPSEGEIIKGKGIQPEEKRKKDKGLGSVYFILHTTLHD